MSARAVVAEADGEVEQAHELFATAAAAWRDFGDPVEEAYAQLGEGRCLVRLGRAEESMPALQAARVTFKRLRATPLVTEVDAVLAQARM